MLFDNKYIYFTRITLYHTIPTLNDLTGKKKFGKQCGKRRKCWYPALSSFSIVFSTLSKREIINLATFNMSSANTFNFVTSKLLAFGKKLYKVLDVLLLLLLLFLTLIPKESHLLKIVQISIC